MATQETLGSKLRRLRINNHLSLRKTAEMIGIDTAILSKMERGQRRISGEVVQKLARIYNFSEEELMVHLMSEKILMQIGEYELAQKVLKVAEEQIAYQTFQRIDKKAVLQKITEELMKYPQIQKAWVFGSFSRNDDRPESDIDIAIQTIADFTYFDLAEVQYKLETSINRKVDVGFIDSFKSYIFKHVKDDLRLIYEKQAP